MHDSLSDCLFCRLVRGEIPSHRVYEDDHTLAFLDIAPVAMGHTLVIPKHHAATMFDCSPTDLGYWIMAVQRVMRCVSKAVSISDITLLQNNGEASGQVIPHLHMHVIPRTCQDGLRHWPSGLRPTPEELAALAERMRSFHGE